MNKARNKRRNTPWEDMGRHGTGDKTGGTDKDIKEHTDYINIHR